MPAPYPNARPKIFPGQTASFHRLRIPCLRRQLDFCQKYHDPRFS